MKDILETDLIEKTTKQVSNGQFIEVRQMLTYPGLGVVYKALLEKERKMFKRLPLNPKERVSVALSKLKGKTVKEGAQLEDTTLVAIAEAGKGNFCGKGKGKGRDQTKG